MDERQIRLLHYPLPRLGPVGVERVCSGIGVPNIYEFLRDEENITERTAIAQLIASVKDHTKAIVEAAFDPQHPPRIVPGDGRCVLGWRHCPSPRETAAKTAVRADFHQRRPL